MVSKNPFLRFIICVGVLVPVYYVLYKIYMPKVNAFGCFDDCFNYVGGFFLGKGKQLYSQIYFNHMPIMAYASYLVQRYTHPINIYALILAHRQFLLLFSFVFNVLIFWRFGIVGFAFVLVYEFSKFYVFGDRFLAESFIVYPMVYLTGLGLYSIERKAVGHWEILLAAVCTWFIIFAREPYILAALFLFGTIVRPVGTKKIGLISICLLIACAAVWSLLFPVRDFISNVITLNLSRGLSTELRAGNFFGTGLLKSFFYPVYLLFSGMWNDFRIQLIFLSSIMGTAVLIWVKSRRNIRLPVYLFLLLGLANLRPTAPGLQYYDAFHEINWYGLFLFSALFLLYELTRTRWRQYLYYGVTGCLVLYVVCSPRSFMYQRVNRQSEFITNYGPLLQVSEVIKAVSGPAQTLFTNGADEFLYVAANRNSSYPYSFYYPTQSRDKYYDAMVDMFIHTPPDLYYDFCSPDAPAHPYMPAEFLSGYAQWYSEGKPTCLYIKKSLVPGLSPAQLGKAKQFLYYLPK